MHTENKWLNWLGYTSFPQLENCKACGIILGGLLALLAVLLIVAMGLTLAQFMVAIWDFETGPKEAIRNIGLILAAMVGFPFIIWRAIVAHRQAETAQQDLITDRINKAVENLGATRAIRKHELVSTNGTELSPEGTYEIEEITQPNLEVRIGGILALERVAQDSPRDHIQIMEILTAYVRQNTPAQRRVTLPKNSDVRPLSIDIQTTLTVLGRRSERGKEIERNKQFRLDLRKTSLTKADFEHGDYSAANFTDCHLDAASFRNAKLNGTQFQRCIFNYTDFINAEMQGTNLDFAQLNNPCRLVPFTEENIGPISLSGTDLSRAKGLSITLNAISTFGSEETSLEADVHDLCYDAPKRWSAMSITQVHDFIESHDGNGVDFRFWSPFSSTDEVTRLIRMEFFKHHDLHKWPYFDPD